MLVLPLLKEVGTSSFSSQWNPDHHLLPLPCSILCCWWCYPEGLPRKLPKSGCSLPLSHHQTLACLRYQHTHPAPQSPHAYLIPITNIRNKQRKRPFNLSFFFSHMWPKTSLINFFWHPQLISLLWTSDWPDVQPCFFTFPHYQTNGICIIDTGHKTPPTSLLPSQLTKVLEGQKSEKLMGRDKGSLRNGVKYVHKKSKLTIFLVFGRKMSG